jgi:uncharacterized protein YbjT (DUF2867 family)
LPASGDLSQVAVLVRLSGVNTKLNIVVIGGTGMIGKKLIKTLSEEGHNATAASPSSGVNTITGEGLENALKGADVVVDVTNSPSFEDHAVRTFFETSTRNLLEAEAKAGVGHHVILSIVGADRLPDSGYLRAKVAQESIIQGAKIPYTILRATQFFEFLGPIVDSCTQGDIVRLPPAPLQPIASDDVVSALARVTVGEPVNGIVDVAGPEAIPMDEIGRRVLTAKGDARKVVTDPEATYFGTPLKDGSLTAQGSNATLGTTRLGKWLSA